MPVSLGEIPGRLVDLGRPPLAPRHPTFAGTQFAQTPPAPPKDTSVVDHAVAGDLMLGKKMHTMSRARTRRRSSRQSAGSGRSRKSAANSDLQVTDHAQNQVTACMYSLMMIGTAIPMNFHGRQRTCAPVVCLCAKAGRRLAPLQPP